MAIAYNIYTNDGAGGPVDDSAPVASATGLTYQAGPLPPSSDTTFLVRAFDAGTGLEEANTGAAVRVVLGPGGEDLSGLPNPPHALGLAPAGNGGCRVDWAYAPAQAYGEPAGFDVYLTAGGTVNYSAAAATVPFRPGAVGYSCLLPGPFAPSLYAAAVRSFNAAGNETNTAVATAFLGAAASPYALGQVIVDFV
jgi:hypothetical protein